MDSLDTEEVDGDTKSMSDDNEELEEDSSEPEVIGLLLHQEGKEGEQEEITVHLDSSGMIVMPPGDSTPQDNSDDITIVDEDGSLSSLPAEPLAEGSIGGSPGAGIDGELGGNTMDDETEESTESGTVGGEDTRIKLEINSDGTLGAIPVSISGAHSIQSISLQSLGLQNGQGVPMGALQAYTMPDGTTAFLQQQVTLKGDDKNFEGHTVQLPDGSTAIVQSVADSEKGDLGGSTSNMESPFAQNSAKGLEGIHAVQLEDGTMAYLTAAHLFDEHGHLDPQAVALEQLQQQQGVQPELENDDAGSAAVPGTSAAGVKRGTAALPLPGPRTAIKGSVQNLLAAAQATPEDRIALANRMEKISQLNSKAYKCTFEGCERLYTTQHHLRVHQRSHTGDRPFKCEFAECGKAFATGYGLKSHIRVHTGEKPYKCPETNCSKAFKTSGDLQKHIRIHTGERPFKCPFAGCFRSFTTSNIRKVHIRTHTGERPYICEEEGCRKAFASATNYKNHIRIHTGEKPYVCTVQGCGKRFTEYSSLYKHHVVHTHSKPYVCNNCGKTYRQTSTLAMHRRTAHGEDLTADTEGTLVFASQEVTLGGLSKGQAGDKNVPVRIQLVQAGDTAIAQGDTGKELVINTSEGQPVTLTDGASLEGGKITLSGSEQQQMVTMASPHLLQQLQGQAITLAGDGSGGQQIYVVTDPSQLEALQQLAAQQQQQQQAALAENVPQAEQTVSEMNVESSHNGNNLENSRGESDLDSSMQETSEDADAGQQHVVMVTADPEGQSTMSSKEQVTVVKHGDLLYVTDSS